MHLTTFEKFKDWAKEAGIGLDPDYPNSPQYHILPLSDHRRYWEYPESFSELPYFLGALLKCVGQAEGYWLIQDGYWHDPYGQQSESDKLHSFLLAKLGLAQDQDGALFIPHSEIENLVAIIFLHISLVPGSVLTDLCLIPDNAKAVLFFDHHEVVHVEFSEPDLLNECIRVMAQEDYPLPDSPPDSTFKPVSWQHGDS